MSKVNLPKKKNGKVSFKLSEHRDHIIRVIKPEAEPYASGTNRARAWNVISLMDGLTVEEANQILTKLEPNIHGKVVRPIGWVVDAIDLNIVEIQKP